MAGNDRKRKPLSTCEEDLRNHLLNPCEKVTGDHIAILPTKQAEHENPVPEAKHPVMHGEKRDEKELRHMPGGVTAGLTSPVTSPPRKGLMDIMAAIHRAAGDDLKRIHHSDD